MRHFMKLLAALAISIAAMQSACADELSFGIISTDSSTSLKERWQPFLDDMQKSTGIKINAYFAPDYAGVIEGMRFNKVQVAWLGNKAAMEAVDRSNAEIFAQVIYANGGAGYKSLIITNVDSPIKSIDDLLANSKNYSFGMGDPSSTSGFLVPSYYVFALHNVDYKTAFRVVRNANHGANLLAVVNKQVDAATNNTEELEKLQQTDPAAFAKVRVIWTSTTIPSDPFVWRKDISADDKAKLQAFIVNYGKDEREKAIIKNIYNYSGFRASTNAQLIPIRQLELFKDKRAIEEDVNLSAQDKSQKVHDIDVKLADLSHQVANN
jgi:phosphonate transport system substrate-binding protein